ncbi:hypothetical protein C0J52_18618 [Blattella germanica]|nr:hypothetical protein C0J52_18618 [Blattella germanica]
MCTRKLGLEVNVNKTKYMVTRRNASWPPWIRDQLNARATSETTRTYRQRHHSHPLSYQQGEYDEDDHDGQMMSGDRLGLKFPDICLMGEEKPQKNLTQETCPDRESNPGPLRERRINGTLITNRNEIQKEIKHRLNSGNACYYALQRLLPSQLLTKLKIYKTVILPVILYGCETWTLTLREEKRFRVFENKVLRKIFGPKRDEETGEWRRLHKTELNYLYGKPDIIRKIKSHRFRWAGHVARMGDERGVRRILEGKLEGKHPVDRRRMKWENNIKHELREVDYTGDDWKALAQDRDVWRNYVRTAMNLRVR